jgi:hypothetical protein
MLKPARNHYVTAAKQHKLSLFTHFMKEAVGISTVLDVVAEVHDLQSLRREA